MNESEKSIHYILNHLESIDRHIKILAGDKKIDIEKIKTLDAIDLIQNYLENNSIKGYNSELDELYAVVEKNIL